MEMIIFVCYKLNTFKINIVILYLQNNKQKILKCYLIFQIVNFYHLKDKLSSS